MNRTHDSKKGIGVAVSTAAAIATLLSLAANADTAGDAEVQAAHRAYLKRDWSGMVRAIHSAWVGGADSVARENLLELYSKAARTKNLSGVDPGWHLPDEMLKMRVHVVRRANEDIRYSLQLSGEIKETATVESLKLTRFPDTVVLDKNGAVGTWETDPLDAEDHSIHYQLKTEYDKDPIPTGLYLLSLKMKSGASADGWFLLDDGLIPTDGPRVFEPSNGQAVTNANPMIRWDDRYRSADYQPEERRYIYAGVALSNPPNYDWEDRWSYWHDSPTTGELQVGITSGGKPEATRLEKGRYAMVLRYTELRRFGDLGLGRTSAMVRPFFVK